MNFISTFARSESAVNLLLYSGAILKFQHILFSFLQLKQKLKSGLNLTNA